MEKSPSWEVNSCSTVQASPFLSEPFCPTHPNHNFLTLTIPDELYKLQNLRSHKLTTHYRIYFISLMSKLFPCFKLPAANTCCPLDTSLLFPLFGPEDGTSMFPWTICIFLSDYTLSHPRTHCTLMQTVFKNGQLSRILQPNREEETEDWRKLHNSYPSPQGMIKWILKKLGVTMKAGIMWLGAGISGSPWQWTFQSHMRQGNFYIAHHEEFCSYASRFCCRPCHSSGGVPGLSW
jgi:hypothetical protein